MGCQSELAEIRRQSSDCRRINMFHQCSVICSDLFENCAGGFQTDLFPVSMLQPSVQISGIQSQRSIEPVIGHAALRLQMNDLLTHKLFCLLVPLAALLIDQIVIDQIAVLYFPVCLRQLRLLRPELLLHFRGIIRQLLIRRRECRPANGLLQKLDLPGQERVEIQRFLKPGIGSAASFARMRTPVL